MKLSSVVLAFAIFCTQSTVVRASNYYFSSVSGDDTRTPLQAQQQATPWKTIAKLNTYFSSLKPGDTVFLQCGSVFSGPLVVSQSGSSGHPLVITFYGSGPAPSISGFSMLTGWVSAGAGIWQSPCTACGTRVNLVDVADSVQPMGRYPNSDAANGGYGIIQQVNDSTSFTDANLGKGPNWTSADLVIRKNRYILERDSILLHAGTSMRYKGGSSVPATVKFGYFIQNSLQTLDKNGEWYYDPVQHKMNMYWTANPSAVSIAASAVDTLVNISKVNYIVFNGIYFQGANRNSVYLFQSSNINFTNCSIRFAGMDGVQSIQSNYLTFEAVKVEYASNNSFDLDGSNNLIQDCRILHTAIYPGLGNAVNSYLGISIHGNNNTVQYNLLDSTGFSPIEFVGASNAVRNNFINYFAFVKDDGGGIYTWAGDIDSATKRVGGWITGNIILNGLTVPAGTDSTVAGIAHGIYLDENSQVLNISGNTVSNCTAGIFIQDSHELTVQGNTFFNNGGQVIFRHNETLGTLRNNDVSHNIAIAQTDQQHVLVASSIAPLSGPPALTSFGSLHDNKYVQMNSNSLFFLLAMKGLNSSGSFGLWKSAYSMDWNSLELPVSFPPFVVNSLIGSDLYTKGSIITPFSTAASGSRVIVNTPIGQVDSGKAYVTHFTLHAPDASHTLLVFLQQYSSPYTHFSPIMNVATVSPSSNNTIVFSPTTGANPSSSIVFQMNQADPRIYIDNIDLYLANVTPVSPLTYYLFQYNASKAPQLVSLAGSYQDAAGVVYQGTVTIPAYGSIVLFKK